MATQEKKKERKGQWLPGKKEKEGKERKEKKCGERKMNGHKSSSKIRKG